MEHRNSTVISAPGSIASTRENLLETVAHEFFHCWNVERIRPKGLEPFDFDRADLSGELWLAEGFTQYYGPLAMQRAQLVDLPSTGRTFADLIEAASAPGHLVRTAEEMSQMAPFVDGGRTIDRTNWPITVTSYYPLGGAIALALDLTLRDRTDGRVSLDDFMQAMWRKYGKPGGAREGYVDHPYTIADAEATLAEVSADRAQTERGTRVARGSPPRIAQRGARGQPDGADLADLPRRRRSRRRDPADRRAARDGRQRRRRGVAAAQTG
jgi:predicted metalloprotease with PDZ domain